MSITIPESYVQQFSSNVHLLAEQKMSRLRGTVRYESVTGESFAVERIGGIPTPNLVTTIHGATPLNNTPHTRRWGFIKDYDVADLIDRKDRIKLLIDPDSVYTMRHAGTMGRGIDDAVIAALGGSAAQGKTGTTIVALPAAQKIASGTTGLTIQKLMQAKEKLDAAEVDEFIPRYFACQSQQIRNLLEDDKVTSADFNTVQALVQGKIDEFMGFRFKRTERLLKTGNDRLCYAYAGLAVTLGVAQEPNSVPAQRPDLRMSAQIYTSGSWGAVRVEDEQVVEVAATEV